MYRQTVLGVAILAFVSLAPLAGVRLASDGGMRVISGLAVGVSGAAAAVSASMASVAHSVSDGAAGLAVQASATSRALIETRISPLLAELRNTMGDGLRRYGRIASRLTSRWYSVTASLQPRLGPLPNMKSMREIINATCAKYGMEEALIMAVVRAESNFNPRAVSSKGARGLMQLMPATARDLGVSDSFDPAENIDGGVRYLKWLLRVFNNDTKLALAAYNAGPTNVRRHKGIPPFRETKRYVKRVLRFYDNYSAS